MSRPDSIQSRMRRLAVIFCAFMAAVLAVNLSACGMGEKEGQDLKIEEKGEESRTSEEEEEDLSETAEDREASASEEQSAQEGMKAAGYDGIELCGFMIHPTGFMVRLMTKAAGMPVGKGGNLNWKEIVKDSGLQVVSLRAAQVRVEAHHL